MTDYMCIKEAAIEWGISPRRVNQLIAGGRIAGVFKLGNTWLMPATTTKPKDLRLKHHKVEMKQPIDSRVPDLGDISKFWYERAEMPIKEKKRIGRLVKGRKIGSISLNGEEHVLLRVDGNVFRMVFIENRKYLYRGEYTAPSDENDYANSSNYLTDDGLAGFSITSSGWLVSLFSNYTKSGFTKAISEYVIHQAYKLVCIVANTDEANGLVRIYQNLYGFRKYSTTIDDEQIMRKYYGDAFVESFVTRNGKPFHVFMIGRNAKGDVGEIRHYKDYFEAEEYVEKTVFNVQVEGDN